MKIKNTKALVIALSLSFIFSACQKNTDLNTNNETTETEITEDTKNDKISEDKNNSDDKKAIDNKDISKDSYSLKDGTYKSEANGYDRKLNIEVDIKDSAISDIILLDNHESEPVIKRAFPIIKKRIIESNSPDVDSVSAATFSTFGVKEAVLDAMKQAGLKDDEIVISRSTGYEDDRKLTEAEDRSADVLVIGGGPAGLSAAIEAKNNGAQNVVLIEKLDILSGNGKFDMNFFNMPNSKAMKENDNEVTKEEFKEQIGSSSRESKERIEKLTDEAFNLDKWLRDMGIDLDYNFGGKGSMNHMAGKEEYAGDYLQTKLEEKANELGIEILTGTKATDLIIEDGIAKGAKVEDKKHFYNINSDATVIATGGFSHNPDMLDEYVKGAGEVPTSNQEGATGDFVKIAKDHDIKLAHMDTLSIFNKILDPRRDLTGNFEDNYIFINQDGDRFIDETGGDIEYAREMIKNMPVYFIFDEAAKESFYRLYNQVDKGYIKKASSIEELADDIGADADNIEASLKSYNDAVEAKSNDPFRKEAGSKIIDPNTNLYYVKVTPAIHMTKGGIEANENAEVLNNEGNIIPGLYAAGEVSDTSGAFSASVIFGKVSGENAALYIKDKE